MKFVKSPIAVAVVALASHQPVAAFQQNSQETAQEMAIERITVVGDFRRQSLQQAPTSLSVLTAEDIQFRSAQHLEELLAASPNVNFASGSQRARYIQIRGIGERSQFKEPINPSVGLIIDDIDFTGVGSVASLYDIAQTEIFRGPQGTRFGANAMAGLVNIVSHQPTERFEGQIDLSAGNYHSFGLGAVLSGPLTKGINYRLAAQQYQSDGFIENSYLAKKDTNNRDELSVRGKLAIEATNDLTIDLGLYLFDFDNGYDAFSLDNNRTTMSDQPGFDRQDTKAVSGKFTYIGFDGVKLLSILSHADSDLAYGYDEDWSFVGLHPWEYSSTDHYFRDRQTTTADFRLLSDEAITLGGKPFDWLVGAYFKSDDEDLVRQYTYLDNDFTSIFATDTQAIYSQLDGQLTEQWSLNFGLRIEQRDADYRNSNGFDYSPSDNMIGGKLVLSYHQAADSLWYGQLGRGYKAGGVNTDGSIPENLRVFEPESVWNYELGYKISFYEQQAYIRTALFYMDRDDVQVKSSQEITRDDNSREFINYLGNATDGKNHGIEVDASWQITPNLTIYGAVGYLHSEFGYFINSAGEDLTGREQAHAPNYQFNVGVNYLPTDNWQIHVSVDGKDEFYFSDSHTERSDSVALINASASYQQDSWQLKLWARNLFDREYANRGFYFGNDPRDGYDAKAYYQHSEPLVFGANFRYEF